MSELEFDFVSSISPTSSSGLITAGVLGFREQRFPESCQRTSLQDEDDDAASSFGTLDIDTLDGHGGSNGDADDECIELLRRSREFLPSSRTLPLPRPKIVVAKKRIESDKVIPRRRSDSWNLPALTSDSDSYSSASSVEPSSPQLPPRWGVGGPERLPPVTIKHALFVEELATPPSSPTSTSQMAQRPRCNDEDFEDHACFSKAVVTKFNNPPRYKLKKVKFHQCSVCQKSFPRPSGLRTHMNKHTKNKPYPCPYQDCDKSFSVISNAKRHYRTHLVDLPPEQCLPSGPYHVDFSDPVIFSSEPPLPISPPSPSSSESSPSPSLDTCSGSTPSPLFNSAGRHRLGSRRVTLRWLPPGADARAQRKGWKAPLELHR